MTQFFYRTKNKKICQRIWVFVICEKFNQLIWKKKLDAATNRGLLSWTKYWIQTLDFM